MNPNICNNCGGDYKYRDGRWICRSCGSYKPEEISNEEVTLLYMAYQKLRLAEFDNAEKDFDDIIEKYPKNSGGYWGRLMARYGIKYERDFDGHMIPTCYATSIESVISTSDYKKALEYADQENKAYYIKQAEYIESVRKEWIKKASKEKDYDIFICYKESDLANNIERTKDSVAAQDLYIHLTKKGYRVFYSHESLRDKVGEKYEPYIFKALSTAKVMLVYGSKPEYISSTWLKNEWTRYEKRLQNGEKKPNSLLVACDGFSPNELPRALAAMQCFNASEKSFYSDLDEAVEKIIAKKPIPIVNRKKSESEDKPRKSKGPIIATLLLLLAVVGGYLGWNFIKPSPSVSDQKYGTVISSDYGSFPWNVSLHVEALSAEGEWVSKIEECDVDSDGIRLYNMSLLKGEETLKWEGDLNVSIPLPKDISEKRAIVYELNGSIPKKVNFKITDGKIVFSTNKLGVYLIAKREHTVKIDAAVAPTCTVYGLTEGTHCSECNEVLTAQQKIPALGHTPGEKATCTTAQTCTVCGTELSVARGHIPGTAATCTTAQICTVCNKKLVAAKGHISGVEATCLSAQTCIECGTAIVEALGHEFVEANCESPKHCNRCGKTEGLALGHTYDKNSCIRCNQMDPKSLPVGLDTLYVINNTKYNVVDTFVDSFGNSYSGKTHVYQATNIYFNPDVENAFSVHNLNGKYSVFSGSLVAGSEHHNIWTIKIYVDDKLLFTISDFSREMGQIDFKICVKDATKLKIAASGGCGHIAIVNAELTHVGYEEDLETVYHNFDAGNITDSTCTDKGCITYTCICCGYKDTEALEVKSHSYEAGDVTAPTCNDKGYTTYSCIYCEDMYTSDYIDAQGHTFGKDITCVVCGEHINVSVGDIITMGSYEQDNNRDNGKESIQWIVLEIQDGRALMISKYALDCQPYNVSGGDMTWEICTLRAWLNDEFLNSAFSAEEQALIPTGTISADANPLYGTDPGNATEDQIFVLSITEAHLYLSSDGKRQCKPTAYAVAKGAYVDNTNDNCWWWLRSAGGNQFSAPHVLTDGSINDYGTFASDDERAIRPAIWIDLNY